MTESATTPNKLESATERDTNLPAPVSATAGIKGKTENKKILSAKSAAIVAAGTAGAAAVAFVVYKKLNKPVPRSEQIARKVRKYVTYLEKHDFEFPELPPHIRKNVEAKAEATAKAGHKFSRAALHVVKKHLPSRWS